MGDMVIVAYRPRAGHEDELLALTRDHVRTLRRLGLATERPTLAMRSREGIVVEVFEWRDGGIAAAHANPDVLAMWERYAAVCDHVPLREHVVSFRQFARFEPIEP